MRSRAGGYLAKMECGYNCVPRMQRPSSDTNKCCIIPNLVDKDSYLTPPQESYKAKRPVSWNHHQQL